MCNLRKPMSYVLSWILRESPMTLAHVPTLSLNFSPTPPRLGVRENFSEIAALELCPTLPRIVLKHIPWNSDPPSAARMFSFVGGSR